MHYDENRRRCALRRCFYDRKFDGNMKKQAGRDVEEAMQWHG
jgi:hypothetical protein